MVAGALTLGFGIALSMCFSTRGIRVRSVDRGLEVYQAKFFPSGRFNATFAPLTEKAEVQIGLLLTKTGVSLRPMVRGFSLHGEGPMLVIYGHFGSNGPPQFELVTEGGQPVGSWYEPRCEATTHDFMWCVHLEGGGWHTNGAYYVRDLVKTNILAHVSVRM